VGKIDDFWGRQFRKRVRTVAIRASGDVFAGKVVGETDAIKSSRSLFAAKVSRRAERELVTHEETRTRIRRGGGNWIGNFFERTGS
jgi:hypothetical protein